MKPFGYHSPDSVADAVGFLDRHPGAVALAGGTDLVLQLKEGRQVPAVVSLKNVSELGAVDVGDDRVRIGAAVTIADLLAHPLIADEYPALAAGCAVIGSPQVRTMATLGGNLCNAAPSADTAAPLLALDASAVIAGPDGERFLPLADFFTGPGETALADGEILAAVVLPRPAGRSTYLVHGPRAAMDITVAGVAAGLSSSHDGDPEIRIALAAVAPTPIRALAAEDALGRRLDPASIAAAAEAAAAECDPITDVRASAEYRRHLVGVFAKRTLEQLASGVSND